MQECESCGEPTQSTSPLISANGTGLSVCEECSMYLRALKWEAPDPNVPTEPPFDPSDVPF